MHRDAAVLRDTTWYFRRLRVKHHEGTNQSFMTRLLPVRVVVLMLARPLPLSFEAQAPDHWYQLHFRVRTRFTNINYCGHSLVYLIIFRLLRVYCELPVTQK